MDNSLSSLRRAVEANPSDQSAARAYASACVRAGAPVPYELPLRLTGLFTDLGPNSTGMLEFRHKTTGMVFVLVPAGSFQMGPPDEKQLRSFDEPFLMAKYPFTAREWYRVTNETPSHFPTREMVSAFHPIFTTSGVEVPSSTRLDLPDNHGRTWGDHPVESVSWDRCQEVTDWINRIDFARRFDAPFCIKEGETWTRWSVYEHGDPLNDVPPASRRNDGELTVPHHGKLIFPETIECLYQRWLWNEKGERVGFQLPTESMWEYCARAGTTTRYPNGDDDAALEKIAWFDGEWEEGHKAVGLKDRNNWGLHDNCGNVFEWTRCLWHSALSEASVNGFIANGEAQPAPKFISDDEIGSTILAIVRSGAPLKVKNDQEVDPNSFFQVPGSSTSTSPGQEAAPSLMPDTSSLLTSPSHSAGAIAQEGLPGTAEEIGSIGALSVSHAESDRPGGAGPEDPFTMRSSPRLSESTGMTSTESDRTAVCSELSTDSSTESPAKSRSCSLNSSETTSNTEECSTPSSLQRIQDPSWTRPASEAHLGPSQMRSSRSVCETSSTGTTTQESGHHGERGDRPFGGSRDSLSSAARSAMRAMLSAELRYLTELTGSSPDQDSSHTPSSPSSEVTPDGHPTTARSVDAQDSAVTGQTMRSESGQPGEAGDRSTLPPFSGSRCPSSQERVPTSTHSTTRPSLSSLCLGPSEESPSTEITSLAKEPETTSSGILTDLRIGESRVDGDGTSTCHSLPMIEGTRSTNSTLRVEASGSPGGAGDDPLGSRVASVSAMSHTPAGSTQEGFSTENLRDSGSPGRTTATTPGTCALPPDLREVSPGRATQYVLPPESPSTSMSPEMIVESVSPGARADLTAWYERVLSSHQPPPFSMAIDGREFQVTPVAVSIGGQATVVASGVVNYDLRTFDLVINEALPAHESGTFDLVTRVVLGGQWTNPTPLNSYITVDGIDSFVRRSRRRSCTTTGVRVAWRNRI